MHFMGIEFLITQMRMLIEIMLVVARLIISVVATAVFGYEVYDILANGETFTPNS